MAVETVSLEDDHKEPVIRTSPILIKTNGAHEKRRLSGGSLRDQYALSNTDRLQTPSEPLQLPSPELSPSPLSSSPPMSLTDNGSFERYGSVDSSFRKRSSSFEYISPPREEESVGETISSPRPISKRLPPHELHQIPEEVVRKPRRSSVTIANPPGDERVLKLSPAQLEELTAAPDSLPLPLRTSPASLDSENLSTLPTLNGSSNGSKGNIVVEVARGTPTGMASSRSQRPANSRASSTPIATRLESPWNQTKISRSQSPIRRASHLQRRTSGDGGTANPSLRANSVDTNLLPETSTMATPKSSMAPKPENISSPIIQDIPLPPMSIPTYLQLELASSRPSPLYIHRPVTGESPYESSRIKFERLLNFLLLPPQLEQVLGFGSLACLDAWLHTFTILPLRFLKAANILLQWWGTVLATEAQFISAFIYHGAGRVWHRQRGRRNSLDNTPATRSTSQQPKSAMWTNDTIQMPSQAEERNANGNADATRTETERKLKVAWYRKHKRTKSQPSSLSSYHKADLLQGMVIVCSCTILMYFDASRMYHSIRGQSAIKLYMIWNVLEVGDRLLAALGQDIFECLFCEETIERGPDGRSKLLRPFGMFTLALVYNVIHAAVLLYQVISLNVAVNSYSNALITLLMSNMFVEIKSTVFKKFEKENIFQLTCADVVERFQLWLMLVVIGLRNLVEVGGLNPSSNSPAAAEVLRNSTVPGHSNFILPMSFTILSSWTGEVLSPFLLVLGSEMIVDWLKHAYISKFNSVKPAIYQKFLDVLAKDYYTNAFVNQNLTKRLGLPVIPLSCLFIRASVQTYHMFLATHIPTPIPSTATELALESEAAASPVTTAALEHFDAIIRRALGRSTFGSGIDSASKSWLMMDMDDAIAFLTMIIFFLCAFLVLLACKLVLGMLLLRYARNRYSSMKQREHVSIDTKGKRLGGWGTVEVDDDKRKWFYADDPQGAMALKERERKTAAKAKESESGTDFARVTRYEMSAKRIW